MRNKIVIFMLAMQSIIPLFSQENKMIDSLLALTKQKKDTALVSVYSKIAEYYEVKNPGLAKQYINKMLRLNQDIKDDAIQMKIYKMYSYVYSYQSQFDSVIYYNKLVLDMAEEKKDTFNIGVSLFNMGVSYRYQSDLNNAVTYMLEGANILQGKGYENIESNVYDGLQTLYYTLGKYDKAIEYGKKAVEMARKTDNKGQLMTSLSNIGLSYVDTNQNEEAKKCFNEALKLAIDEKNIFLQGIVYNNLCDIYLKEGNYGKVKEYSDKAIIMTKDVDSGTYATANLGLAAYYLTKKNYQKAHELALESLKLSREENLLEGIQSSLGMLTNIAFASQNYKEGFEYYYQKLAFDTKVFNKSMQENESNMRIKYETQKKEQEITFQKEKLEKRRILITILLVTLISLLIAGFLYFRYYRLKQINQNQQIKQLETEKQLLATESVIKGEEQERSRLAKDLHDGLGGMLSGIKHSLYNMKGNLIMTPENAKAFERSLDMLDSSIKEMRRVAHNMMPEALVKFGLDTALRDFCSDINQSGKINITYQSYGLENKEIEQNQSITLYRIVQELVNNALKHSGANEMLVQLSHTDSKLSITVEDNGKGFDTQILNEMRGMGWSNIQSRVDFLKGTLDVHSDRNSGTSILIEVEI